MALSPWPNTGQAVLEAADALGAIFDVPLVKYEELGEYGRTFGQTITKEKAQAALQITDTDLTNLGGM